MPTEETTHYVAVLKIEKVVTPVQNLASPVSNQKRRTSEVSQMTLKSSELWKLISKLGAHLEIIEED